MDPDPNPTLDPAPFFSDFKDAKKTIFYITYLQAHYLQSLKPNADETVKKSENVS
jgi:hypothetical protein